MMQQISMSVFRCFTYFASCKKMVDAVYIMRIFFSVPPSKAHFRTSVLKAGRLQNLSLIHIYYREHWGQYVRSSYSFTYSLNLSFMLKSFACLMQDSSEKGFSLSIRRISCTIASVSLQSTIEPVSTVRISGLPPVRKVRTGVPHAIASMLTVG